MNIAVLGAGMVGRAMALDLVSSFTVTSFDVSEQNLQLLKERNSSIQIQQADLKQYNQYEKWLKPFDIVVTAVPGFMGFDVLRTVINCGKDVADISFFPEDVLQLNKLAKEKNVTVITDIGVAPGMSNLILGRYNEEMKIANFECYVGGLPKQRKKPFEYKAPFSPVDVIEEYTRPARLKENGQIVTKPALTEREYINFDEIGTLEAFNTDGLRSLLFTMSHIANMKEKTLRYPGHIELIIALKQAGFFNEQEIEINGVKVSPLKFSSKILFNDWKLGYEEEELTVMKVIIEGEKNGSFQRVEYNMLDRYDAKTKTFSMSRTTGYTCTATVNLIAKKIFTEKGVFPPELIGKNKDCFDFVVNYLKERGVNWKSSVL
ncbi:MAG TPA: saccharopine dehydrogenase C-terminal domain-containing protein [Chitinophagaceae bacterium]|jgi:saccharopine dehydrogenase-like NADP-dependent oxidoreductase|nr:saccharopine dehydrogenase C-terminal domain-containing protein [Chitinophagaceae bacterium]